MELGRRWSLTAAEQRSGSSRLGDGAPAAAEHTSGSNRPGDGAPAAAEQGSGSSRAEVSRQQEPRDRAPVAAGARQWNPGGSREPSYGTPAIAGCPEMGPRRQQGRGWDWRGRRLHVRGEGAAAFGFEARRRRVDLGLELGGRGVRGRRWS